MKMDIDKDYIYIDMDRMIRRYKVKKAMNSFYGKINQRGGSNRE